MRGAKWPRMSSSSNTTPSKEPSFEALSKCRLSDSVSIEKLRSKRTGLTVYLVHVPCPLTNGYLLVPTEPDCDNGAAHTLEHLVFMGSRLYPYKGVLDIVANRCFADGTNAWTDVNNTTYTTSHVGLEGFLSLLPIYVDHVLNPTLEASAYITEVHHISSDGEDGGVVYSEMQDCENTASCLMDVTLRRALFPKSGYSFESGGKMSAIRDQLGHDRVVAFHRRHYQPQNLAIVVSGIFESARLLDAIVSCEDKVILPALANGGSPLQYIRPWSSPARPLLENRSFCERITYPADDIETGSVSICYRLDFSPLDSISFHSYRILAVYLTNTLIAPFEQVFVECEEPWMSSVSYSVMPYSDIMLGFYFEDVVFEKLEQVENAAVEVLRQVAFEENSREEMKNTSASSSDKEKPSLGFDFDRLRTVLKADIRSTKNNLESSPKSVFVSPIINDFIYGSLASPASCDSTPNSSIDNALETVEKLLERPKSYWLQLLRSLLDRNYVCVVASPSEEHKQKLIAEERDRVETRRQSIGAEGLKAKGDQLRAAIENNDMPPPDELVIDIPVPNVADIKFIPFSIGTNFKLDVAESFCLGEDLRLDQLPFRMQVVQANSEFMELVALFDTTSIDQSLRQYLVLFSNLFADTDVLLEDGKTRLPYEEVVATLEDLTVYVDGGFGLSMSNSTGEFSQLFSAQIKVERNDYDDGVVWLWRLLCGSRFTKSRVKNALECLYKELVAERRTHTVGDALLDGGLYSEQSNRRLCNLFAQLAFVKRCLEDVSKTVSCLEQLQQGLLKSGLHDGVSFQVSGNAVALGADCFTKPWLEMSNHYPLYFRCGSDAAPFSVPFSRSMRLPSANGLLKKSLAMIGNGAVESGSLRSIASLTELDFNSEETAAMVVFLQFVLQLEGPAWRRLRGQGLAYSYDLTFSSEQGVLTLDISKSTHVHKAYAEFVCLLSELIDKCRAAASDQLLQEVFPESELQAAKSTAIYQWVSSEKSFESLFELLLYFSVERRPVDFNRRFVHRLWNVTRDQLRSVCLHYISRLCAPERCVTVVCVNPSKLNELAEFFLVKFNSPAVVYQTPESDQLFTDLKIDACKSSGFAKMANSGPPNHLLGPTLTFVTAEERKKANTCVQFYSFDDYYCCYFDDARLIAMQLWCVFARIWSNPSALKVIGRGDSRQYCTMNRSRFELALRELLLLRHYSVDVFINDGTPRQPHWVARYRGSPGNVSQFEDVLSSLPPLSDANATCTGVMAIVLRRNEVSFAACNLSAQTVTVGKLVDVDQLVNLETAVVQMAPGELVCTSQDANSEPLRKLCQRNSVLLTPQKRVDEACDMKSHFSNIDRSTQVLLSQLQQTEWSDCLLALTTLKRFYSGALSPSNIETDGKSSVFGGNDRFRLEQYNSQLYCKLNAATLKALNVFPDRDAPNRGVAHNRTQSLYNLLNYCRTVSGQRLLGQWLRQPLLDTRQIDQRLDLVQLFLDNTELRCRLHEVEMRRIVDLETLSRRFVKRSATLQDAYRVMQTLERVPVLIELLETTAHSEAERTTVMAVTNPMKEFLSYFGQFQAMLNETLDFEKARNGEFCVRASFDPNLEQLRQRMDGYEAEMSKELNKAARHLQLEAGKSVRLEQNSQYGNYLRVTRRDEQKLRGNSTYSIIDVTKGGGVRFTTNALRRLNEEWLDCRRDYEETQSGIVEELIDVAAGYTDAMIGLGQLFSRLDVLVSFSVASVASPVAAYVRPQIQKQEPVDSAANPLSPVLHFEGLRHPCLELQADVSFVPNDVRLNGEEDGSFLIVTGPNMGGKSTYIRSVGVATLLAQIGCFVPASSAQLTVRDSILTRVGAGDNIVKGLSTFMKEMLDMAYILQTASRDSLVIIDELGRGTSTYDGFGLVWAISEELLTRIGCFCICASHFHELTTLQAHFPKDVRNYHMAALVEGGELVLLYELRKGPCSKSFGVHVAKMTEFPEHVVVSADAECAHLERGQIVASDTTTFEQVAEGHVLIGNALEDLVKWPLHRMTPDQLNEKWRQWRSQLTASPNPFIQRLLAD